MERLLNFAYGATNTDYYVENSINNDLSTGKSLALGGLSIVSTGFSTVLPRLLVENPVEDVITAGIPTFTKEADFLPGVKNNTLSKAENRTEERFAKTVKGGLMIPCLRA